MDLINILILFSALIYLFLGLLILSKGRNKIVNIIYSLISFSVLYWSIGMVGYRYVRTVESSIIWCKILYTAPIFIVGVFLLFTYYFPHKKKHINWVPFWIVPIFSSLFISLSLFSNLLIENVILQSDTEKIIIFGPVYFFYGIWIISIFLWAYINLLLKYRKSVGISRNQILYVFWGTFISSMLSMFTNLTLPSFGIFTLNWAGQILSLIMVFFIAYAIIRHRLMDIKFVMRRYSVFLASVFSIIVPAVVIRLAVDEYVPEISIYVDILILFLAVYYFTNLRDFYFHLANKYFFSSLYDSNKVIADISDKLRSTLSIVKIHDYIYQSLNAAFHIKLFGILNLDNNKKVYKTVYNINFNLGRRLNFESDPYLHSNYTMNNLPIVISELNKQELGKRTLETIEMMANLGVEVLIPMNVKDEVVGLIALGAKESGDMYNDEDLQVLEIISSQSAIAIENAKLFEETKNFGNKLKREVESATKELKKANVKLKKLDAAKSEFISIASHQLRTPLSVIKGYISMMIEGNFGKITKSTKRSLQKVFESNERLISLVENLLNVSRIESGRLQFRYEITDMSMIAESVVEELEQKAKSKDLKLVFKKPKDKLPKVRIDTEKIRQVMMNLVDNAIKYSLHGDIVIKLKHFTSPSLGKKSSKNKIKSKDGALEFSVTDSGIGIKEEEMHMLFKKFSRGEGTALIYTEGTGLGLYVAREMVEAHQGRIWAESKGSNKGSTFLFQIPVVS